MATNDDKGIGSPNDQNKSTPKAGSSATGTIDSVINGTPVRTYNPLSQFSSYTYNIGLYYMNKDLYNDYIDGDNSAINKMSLIVQSGGIRTSGNNPKTRGLGKDSLDFYIDDLSTITYVTARDTKNNANSIIFKFKVYEPYGFTFPKKLVEVASKEYLRSNTSSDDPTLAALKETYLLLIRFYGYDSQGNIVTKSNFTGQDNITKDNQSVFERAFPITIKSFDFKLENSMVVYNIDAVLPNIQVAAGQRNATMPDNGKIKGETVQDMLTGPNGLKAFLNKYQKTLVDKEQITVPNKYDFTIQSNSTIGDSKMHTPGELNKNTIPNVEVKNSNDVNVKTEQQSGVANTKEVELTFNTGDPILYVVEKILTNSDFSTKPTKISKENQYQTAKGSEPLAQPQKPTKFQWYNILPKVKKLDKDPNKGNDYSYDINYYIRPYKIPYILSTVIGYSDEYYGPNKRYSYWYMGGQSSAPGENNPGSEIISYEQTYKTLYFMAADATSPGSEQNLNTNNISKSPMPTQQGNQQGKEDGVNSAVASIKSFLYSPSDQVHAKIKILGDPDYLMPLISGVGIDQYFNDTGNFPLGPDSSINPMAQEFFIEIDFKQTEDYDSKTGLMPVNSDILFMNYPPNLRKKIKGTSFWVTEVHSVFSKGLFTQELKTTLPTFSTSGSDTETDESNRENTETTTSNPGINGRLTSISDPRSSVYVSSTSNNVNTPVPVDTKVDNPGKTTGANAATTPANKIREN